jgi:hypothetical protein
LTLEQFIEDALCSISNDKTYTLNITKEACEAIKKHTNLNICKYKFIIEESYVRHVRNNHPEDLYLLYKVPIILNSFSHVEKSITPNKQTKENEVSLGFTGTPLLKKEKNKNSFLKFGGEIHRYTIDDAVKDGAVLPLLYEGRLVDQQALLPERAPISATVCRRATIHQKSACGLSDFASKQEYSPASK